MIQASSIASLHSANSESRLEELIDSIKQMYQRLADSNESENGNRELRSSLKNAQDEFASLVYSRLYQIACSLIKTHNGTPTLGPTALVNETYAKLLNAKSFCRCNDLQHFIRQFAMAVKHTWYSYLRKKSSDKRGGGWKRWDLEVVIAFVGEQCTEMNDLFSALDNLEQEFPRASQVLHSKFFLLMKVDEIKSALSISRSTVEADLRLAKAYVRSQIDAVGRGNAASLPFRVV